MKEGEKSVKEKKMPVVASDNPIQDYNLKIYKSYFFLKFKAILFLRLTNLGIKKG